MKIINTNKLAI